MLAQESLERVVIKTTPSEATQENDSGFSALEMCVHRLVKAGVPQVEKRPRAAVTAPEDALVHSAEQMKKNIDENFMSRPVRVPPRCGRS